MKAYDKHFIKRLKQKDRMVQKQLFDGLYALMFRVCQRYIVQTDEAEDCLMKGFLKAFQQIDGFENTNNESLYWWVRRIMINECLMQLRKKQSFLMVNVEDELEHPPVSAEVWEKLESEDLLKLIMLLPAGYRTIFSLFVVEGYSHQEIASMLGITESTSKSQLFKARLRLKQLLQTNQHYGIQGR